MKYSSPRALDQGLTAHLKTVEQERGVESQRAGFYVAFERLLARLCAVGDTWMLKGGFALLCRFGLSARPTKDVDIAVRTDDESDLRELVAAACQYDAGDFFSYRQINVMAKGGGLQFTLQASLGSQPFSSKFTLDCGMEPWQVAQPLPMRSLLEFAGLSNLTVPVIRPAFHAADKVHAIVKQRDYPNYRVKDLIDLALLVDRGLVADRTEFRNALQTVFQNTPDALSPPAALDRSQIPSSWSATYAAQAQQVGLEPELDRGLEQVNELLRGSAASKE